MAARAGVRDRLYKHIDVVLLVAVLFAGGAIRLAGLSTEYLWADEAESGINALTILERGYPTDSYLGLPVYENTLTREWPEHQEYEFRDSSYSSKGMAVYHGWLPLYAIAGSFAAFGIGPQAAPESLPAATRDLRTFAARLPAVIFGVALLLALYVAGRAFYGRDAAWAAVVIACLSPAAIGASRQARYYAATVLFGLLCGLASWWMVKRASWREVAVGAVLFVLLFHTHILTFAALAIVLAAATWSNPKAGLRNARKLAVFGCIVAAGTVPWLLWTGMPESAAAVPKVLPLLELKDVVSYPVAKWPYTLLVTAGLVLVALRRRLPKPFAVRLGRPLAALQQPYWFTFAWLFTAFACFLILTPAASFFQSRMFTILGGPGILLAAMLFAAVGRGLSARHSIPIAAAVALVFVLVMRVHLPAPERDEGFTAVLDHVERAGFGPETKLYALPSHHLVLTFYSGLPFQSVAPVRKSFLDSYPGRVVIVEKLTEEAGPDDPAGVRNLRAAAASAGVELSAAEAERLSGELASYDFRVAVQDRVAGVWPPPADPPPFAMGLLELQREQNRRHFEAAREFAARVPMTRGFEMRAAHDLGCTFFYRFVDPHSRCGPNVNFAERLKTSHATVLGGGWVLYDSPARGAAYGT